MSSGIHGGLVALGNRVYVALLPVERHPHIDEEHVIAFGARSNDCVSFEVFGLVAASTGHIRVAELGEGLANTDFFDEAEFGFVAGFGVNGFCDDGEKYRDDEQVFFHECSSKTFSAVRLSSSLKDKTCL